MGFEQLAALRDQLAAQAAEQQRQSPQRKDAGKPRRNPSSDKTPPRAAGQGQAPGQGQQRRAPAQRRSAPRQERPEPVDPVVLAIAKLQRQFPQAFPKKPAPKVPLKLGIHRDLYALAETLQLEQPQIKEAIQAWCQGSRYWACLVQDAARLDLNGAQDGTVTVEEAKRARQLAGRQRWQARNAKKQADKAGQADEAQADASAPAPVADAAAVDASSTPAATDAPVSALPVDPSDAPAWDAAAEPDATPSSADIAADQKIL